MPTFELNPELCLPLGRLIEGMVTTRNADGSTNISPMGPIFDAGFTRIRLRPFATSMTFTNLRRHGEGVFHVTDDVELIVQAAIDAWHHSPELVAAEGVGCLRLADTCRWYGFRLACIDESRERVEIEGQIISSGHVRDFVGFNRAKHAVVEGAIHATRLHLLRESDIREEWRRIELIVEKTGSEQERRALAHLTRHVLEHFPSLGSQTP